MENNQNGTQSSRPRKISWRTIVLALLTIITFFATYERRTPYYYDVMPMGTREGGIMENAGDTKSMAPTSAGAPAVDTGVSNMYYPYPYPDPNVSANDTREFLKIYYNALLQTRDVQGLTRRVETTVRGHQGRVDGQSSGDKYGSVSFVVPQSKYNAFRDELESLVSSKFITINISSQNLLSQKLSIEEQEKQADKALSDYKAMRAKLITGHSTTVRSLQSQINTYTQELLDLKAKPSTPEIQTKIQDITNILAVLNQNLASENSSYTKELNNIDTNIKYAEDWQKAVEKQDQTFLDNVATVNGTVSISWISLGGIAKLYLPGYTIPGIFALLTAISFFFDRRRFRQI